MMRILFLLTLIIIVNSLHGFRIKYPESHDFDNNCSLSDGTKGSCVNYKECEILHDSSVQNEIKTCYFERFEHFVCCAGKEFDIEMPPTSILPPLSSAFNTDTEKPVNFVSSSTEKPVSTPAATYLPTFELFSTKPPASFLQITNNPKLSASLGITTTRNPFLPITSSTTSNAGNPFLPTKKPSTSTMLPPFLQLTKKPTTTTLPPGIPHVDFPALPLIDPPIRTTESSTTTDLQFLQPLLQVTPQRAAKPCSEPEEFHITVVSGLKTAPDEFPYMMALGFQTFEENVYDYRCGGALIAEDFILTAAHCAYSDGLPPLVALPGGVPLNNTEQRVYKIKRVIEHPDYDGQLAYNDLALMELEEPIMQSNIKPICLWDSLSLIQNDGNVTAIGYGHTRFAGSSSNELLKAYLQVVDTEECKKFYATDDNLPQGLLESQMCAKDPDNIRDTCQGDSGGPLVMYTGFQKAYIVGITSFGQACAREPPGVYTRIASYTDWIDSIVWPK